MSVSMRSLSPPEAAVNKTILVTGSSSGIGFCVANYFYAKGWNVIASMRTPQQQNLRPASNRMLIVPMDVRHPQSVDRAINAGIKTFGKIDVVVNNAAYAELGLFETVAHEKVLGQFETNVFGAMHVIRAILPHFRMNRSGVIINMGAGQSLVASPMLSVYSATKFAMDGLAEALSYELAPLGVLIKQIIPHGTVANTTFVPKAQKTLSQNSQPMPHYGTFVQKMGELFGGKKGFKPSLTTEDVAETVWEAVHDPSKKLRYFVGADRTILSARYGTTSDEEYMLRMRAYFRP
ncbi:short-chain alcohol dehydrogenase [Flagelloscypha sp. PMI_526]|nr:short-chain alcohol dehydrogenase [Flagelloscypha sp. PMI_526]